MAAANDKMVHKIKFVFNPQAETAEEFLTVFKEYCYRGDVKEFNLFTSNLKFREFLELCTQPKTDEEKDSILSDFNNKFKNVSQKQNFCVFDVLCLYALYYVYESNSPCLTAVSRALYAWYKLDHLVSRRNENRNSMILPDNDSFLAELRQFRNLYTDSEDNAVLIFAEYESVINGNSSLARFLLKFGLIQFECNVNSVQILSMVLKKFKGNPEVTISVELEELAFRTNRSKLTFRRFVLTFYTIVLVAEYKMYELQVTKTGEEVFEKLKCMSVKKLRCLDLLLSATTETKISSKDIEYFIGTILNPFENAEFSMCDLLETFQKMSYEANVNYNPRSLKDLTRCKIRSCLQSQLMLPEQVKKLAIPDPLKQFLLFHSEEMWDLLEKSHENVIFVYDT